MQYGTSFDIDRNRNGHLNCSSTGFSLRYLVHSGGLGATVHTREKETIIAILQFQQFATEPQPFAWRKIFGNWNWNSFGIVEMSGNFYYANHIKASKRSKHMQKRCSTKTSAISAIQLHNKSRRRNAHTPFVHVKKTKNWCISHPNHYSSTVVWCIISSLPPSLSLFVRIFLSLYCLLLFLDIAKKQQQQQLSPAYSIQRCRSYGVEHILFFHAFVSLSFVVYLQNRAAAAATVSARSSTCTTAFCVVVFAFTALFFVLCGCVCVFCVGMFCFSFFSFGSNFLYCDSSVSVCLCMQWTYVCLSAHVSISAIAYVCVYVWSVDAHICLWTLGIPKLVRKLLVFRECSIGDGVHYTFISSIS